MASRAKSGAGISNPAGIAAHRSCAECGFAKAIPAALRPRHRDPPGTSSTDCQ
jgi:hypothetical protein